VTGAVRRARTIRRRLTDVPFAGVFALLGINQAIMFAGGSPGQPAGLLAAPLDYVWVAMYTAGGALIIAGLVTVRANLEAAGCIAFGVGAAVSALATGLVRHGWLAADMVAVLVVFAAAGFIRAYHLFHGRVLVLLDPAAVTDLRGHQ
jgi:hypothetical protein